MLDNLITSKTRVKLLTLFLENKSEMFHVREIVRRVDEEINAVRRELLYLEKKGILSREPRANRVYYYLNKHYLYYSDLVSLSAKTSGLGYDMLRNRVKLGKIKFAMLAGKFVKGIRDDQNQVDVLVIGTVVLPELAQLIRQEEARRNHEINYTVMTEEEFDFRKKRRDPFILSVLAQSRVMLMGDEDALLA